jgi:hypothetical protein
MTALKRAIKFSPHNALFHASPATDMFSRLDEN